MAKAGSRVGSLYYQILLDGVGVETGAKKIRKSIANVNKFLKRDGEKRLDNEAGINKRYMKLFEDIEVAFKGNHKAMTEALDAAEKERLDTIKEYHEKQKKERQDALEEQRKLELKEMLKTAKDKEELAADIQKRGAMLVSEDGKAKGSKAAWLKGVRDRAEKNRKELEKAKELKEEERKLIIEEERKTRAYLHRVKMKSYEMEKQAALDAAEEEANELDAFLKKIKLKQGLKKGVAGETPPIDAKLVDKRGMWEKFINSSFIKSFDKAFKVIGKVTVGLFVFEQALKRVGAVIGTFVGAMTSMVAAADRKKKQLIVLSKLYAGNRGVVRKLREELVEYAKSTAFSVEGTMELATQLRALGFSAEETVSSIRRFGKLSFGDPAKLKLIAKAYSDVKAQGKLMATEVRQFANQGVPILSKLQEMLGVSSTELRKMIENGQVGFEDVAKAVDQIATSFGNVDTAAMETFSGQMEAAAESWEQLKAETAEGLGLDKSFLQFGIALNLVIEGLKDTLSYVEAIQDALSGAGTSLTKVIADLTNNQKLYYIIKTLDYLSGASVSTADLAEQERKIAEMNAQLADQEAKKAAADKKEADRWAKEDAIYKRTLRYEAELAAIHGNDGPLRQLEMQIRLQEVKNQAIKDGLDLKEQELAVEREHELQMARSLKEYQDAKADSDKIQGDFDNSISARGDKDLSRSLPTQQIRQGSVDEWMFEMQEKRRQEDAKAASDKALKDHKDRIEAANIIVDGFHEAYNNIESITLEEV